MSYTSKDYAALLSRLEALSEEKYKAFTRRLIPGLENVYGVRSPVLRKLAREIIHGDWRGYLAAARDTSHEERLLQSMVIHRAKCTLEEKLAYIAAFVPKIDNWAVCDIFASAARDLQKDPEAVGQFVAPYFESEGEYPLRFAIVMRMAYHISPEYIDETLLLLSAVRPGGYYAKMAAAWALSECYVAFPQKTMALLRDNAMDDFTHNKAILKIRESFRVSDEDKRLLNDLKRKKNKEKPA
ncbi:MAG: DNA alkylation repair protein [Christensenellales bacterium]